MEAVALARLWNAAEIAISDTELSELVQKTEGSPAGLYLAALATRASGRKTTAQRSEETTPTCLITCAPLLADLPEDELRFLTRTSVLERMSGSLCDTALASTGSAERLASLEAPTAS